MSSTISSSSTSTPPAYEPSLTSLPTATTPLHNDDGFATIDIHQHQEASETLPQAKSWLRRWFSRGCSPTCPSPLSPEAEYEREQKRQVTSGVVYFTLAIAILIGSCVGAGVSISNLKRSLAYTEPPAPRTLDDFLHLSKDSNAYTDQGSDISNAAEVYLVAVCSFSAVASFIFSLLAGGRLALAVHYRNLSKQDKTSQETRFWKRMSSIFGSTSMCSKKPQLPTYGHAVRQAVLKRDARQGDAQSEFFNISAEEMELERIRKLGGAPPCYHHDKVAHTETA